MRPSALRSQASVCYRLKAVWMPRWLSTSVDHIVARSVGLVLENLIANAPGYGSVLHVENFAGAEMRRGKSAKVG